MYSVYAIYNFKHNKLYIGQSQDVSERLKLHQNGFFKNSYTARFDGKWVLIYTENVPTRRDALRREKELKSYRGRQFIKSFVPQKLKAPA